MRRTDRTQQPAASLNRTATSATVHCLTGCAIGEVLGLVLAIFPVNRALIARGKGHAVVHAHHAH